MAAYSLMRRIQGGIEVMLAGVHLAIEGKSKRTSAVPREVRGYCSKIEALTNHDDGMVGEADSYCEGPVHTLVIQLTHICRKVTGNLTKSGFVSVDRGERIPTGVHSSCSNPTENIPQNPRSI